MSSSYFSITSVLGFYYKIWNSNIKTKFFETKSLYFLDKNYGCSLEENFIEKSKEEYLNKNITTIDYIFFEEMKSNIYLLRKIKNILNFLKKEKGLGKNNNIFIQRNIECLELNLEFLTSILTIFLKTKCKLNNFKNTHMNHEKLDKQNFDSPNNFDNLEKLYRKKIFSYQKIHLIKIYISIRIKFGDLRKNFDKFFWSSFEEENRFINCLRKFYYLNHILEKPSKIGLLYLRNLKFYLTKILKNLRDDLYAKMNLIKLGYYITKMNFFCCVSADFLILKENNLFEKNSSDIRWKNIFNNLKIEVKLLNFHFLIFQQPLSLIILKYFFKNFQIYF